ncbi:AMSH-like ubiquitin thioesterase 2 [Platanthera guangdongensis]|uniref:AMSH-like ubiquitin thioesterase 2 n=1 Tax=Platanthera guangdongensis TaxID=2320717 RepID=A0ABR2MAE9_9ASPA
MLDEADTRPPDSPLEESEDLSPYSPLLTRRVLMKQILANHLLLAWDECGPTLRPTPLGILQQFAKELENLNSQNAGENDGSSKCSTGCYRQTESDSHNSHTDRKVSLVNFGIGVACAATYRSSSRWIPKSALYGFAPAQPTASDIYQCVCEAARRTPSTTSMYSSTTFQDTSINRHFGINVNYGKHYFPSPSLLCVEAPPIIGHVSRVTFPEPDKLDVKSCEEFSTSSAIKDIHISAGLMEEFMELAKDNTEKDLETCGILGASLCQALNEEEIHAILDGESLYPAGWIHVSILFSIVGY